jgi:drug/metabolite transporter (DMT)-like permease
VSALSGRRLAMYVALCAVWGSTWLAIKIGLADLPPLRFAGLRMALACALVAPFAASAWRGGRRPSAFEARAVAWNGLLQIGVQYACIFTAEQWIDSGLAALLFATFPIWVGVFAHFLIPNEPLTARTLSSAGLGLAGVAVIEAPAIAGILSAEMRPLLSGGALMIFSALVAAHANVLNKKHLDRVAPVHNVFGQTIVGSAMLLVLAAVFERGAPARWTPAATAALVYLAVLGTALPFAGLFWLIKRVPLAVIGTIPVVDTVIAVALGAVVLGEKLSWRLLLGGLLILGAVLLVTRSEPPKPSASANTRGQS